MNYTHQEMLDLINRSRNKLADQDRENYTSRENQETARTIHLANSTNNQENLSRNTEENATLGRENYTSRPREECKNKKIKKQKHISREMSLDEESDVTCPSDPSGIASREVSPEGLIPQEEGVVEITPRENITSRPRTYTGIEAFHNKTPKGIKINLAFQSADEADLGACVKVTGELKRQERFREIKDYDGDEDYFKEFVRELKKIYQTDKSAEWCIGRVHARGKRSEWFENVVVLGRLENDVITKIRIWFEEEDYEFDLDLTLNSNQQEYYHTGGRYGSIKSAKKVPSLRTAERVLYK